MTTLTIGSLFSGIGGLELGVMAALADLGVAAPIGAQFDLVGGLAG